MSDFEQNIKCNPEAASGKSGVGHMAGKQQNLFFLRKSKRTGKHWLKNGGIIKALCRETFWNT